MIRIACLAALALCVAAASAAAADLDRTAVDFKTPAEIKWVKNMSGTNESAVLFGDPTKPGPYVVRIKWLPGNMSRPHYDGAKDEETIIQVWGMGPATSTPVGSR